MGIHVTTTDHGAAALDALAAAVRAAQAGDPLAAVAVVVPTNTAGVMARRALGRRGGFAAIDVLTTFRLAELLGAPSLHAEGRRPVSTPVVDLAVRRIIHDNPGLYAGVERHQSTVVALRDLYRELRSAGAGSMTALARTERGGEPARVAAEVARRLRTDWYDEGDLLARAVERARADLPARFHRLVVHLPQRLRPLELQLLHALAEHGTVDVVVGTTGDPAADAGVLDLAAALAGGPIAPAPPPPPPGAALEVVSTTDADDEVREAVRTVVDAARRGTPFDRIAVLYPAERPYARLVEHGLDVAGVPWNGRPGTDVDERMVPRVLAELLDLDRRGLRRSDLMTLLADVPARRADGTAVPTARWERVGRAAGVVRDADWATHLPRFAAEVRGTDRWDAADDAAAALDLLAFAEDLRGRLGDPAATRPWTEWVAWSTAVLEHWFGPGRLNALGGAEGRAWEQTSRVLDRLAHLDGIGPPVTRAEFRSTFVAELEITPGRHGTIGDGVHVSTLAGAAGIDVDLVVVLGAAEGLLPPGPTIDPLVGDHERELAGLARADELTGLVHRQFLAAVTTTPAAVVTVPRGDLRVTAARYPSRWLTPFLEGARERIVDSHAHGVAVTAFPASPDEHRLRALWTGVRAGADVRRLDLAVADPVLSRALALRDARASDRFTAYDGNLAGHHVDPLPARVSPTRMAAWPACPHAYFVQYVLGVRRVEEPEDIESLSAVDRGSALHAALDRLHRDVLTGVLPAPERDGWRDVHVDALLAAGEQVADALEASGRTGRDAFWANERVALTSFLARWADFDREQWRGGTLLASEHEFGGDRPVPVPIPGGRTIGFAGTIDRVDELPDGTLLVIDHKTGKPGELAKLSAEDPTLGATTFQLPVYAAAARHELGRPAAPVEAGYTFFRPFKRVSIRFDDDVWARVGAALGRVVDGIEAGYFPPRPAQPGWRRYVPCWFCEPDGLGTAGRWAEWERKRRDPLLARWFGEPDEPGGAS
ncbi:MAG TPA: PD-(D/E)XK nuclease family protein [Ilumatobacteraceae bacterium]|nr:PD-(D/E)XK nuclease family protein [Ilumatobacteraceae bacterium]